MDIFLGEPPIRIKKWIEDHYGPAVKPDTHIKFIDGTEDDYLIEGAMDFTALIAAGLMLPGSGIEGPPSWIKEPLEANIGSSVTSIGDSVFDNCYRLASVTIPDSVTSIGDYVFYCCNGLTSVTIPDSVTSIGRYAFFACAALTSLTIPDSVTEIGAEAFDGCARLTSVTIGNSVTSIGDHAFFECSSLTSLTIPDSVTSIGDYAFYYCSGLTSVTIVANGGNAEAVKSKMISAGVNSGIEWIMPR